MKLQEEVLGYSVAVPLHANCHRADLAFRFRTAMQTFESQL